MATLKEIKNRIASVRSTLKITSAMKLVASAKLRKAQAAIEGMRPYQLELTRTLGELMAGTSVDGLARYYASRELRSVALVCVASNSSLCGGFNANAIRAVRLRIAELQAAGVSEVRVYAIGRKMAEAFKGSGLLRGGDYSALSGKPSYSAATELSSDLIDDFLDGKVDRVELIYNHFISAGSQKVVCETYLPLSGNTSADAAPTVSSAAAPARASGSENLYPSGNASAVAAPAGASGSEKFYPSGNASLSSTPGADSSEATTEPKDDVYIVEPDKESIVEELLPKTLKLSFFTALLDSAAAEHAARTVAMQTASDNAEDLLQELSLEYNKGRQQKITNELLDLAGGTA